MYTDRSRTLTPGPHAARAWPGRRGRRSVERLGGQAHRLGEASARQGGGERMKHERATMRARRGPREKRSLRQGARGDKPQETPRASCLPGGALGSLLAVLVVLLTQPSRPGDPESPHPPPLWPRPSQLCRRGPSAGDHGLWRERRARGPRVRDHRRQTRPVPRPAQPRAATGRPPPASRSVSSRAARRWSLKSAPCGVARRWPSSSRAPTARSSTSWTASGGEGGLKMLSADSAGGEAPPTRCRCCGPPRRRASR